MMSDDEKRLWDEYLAIDKRRTEALEAWAVEHRKRIAAEEQERINKLVEERLAAVARG